ncbi:ATP-dependent Clp protease ATP-binding subunit [Pedobacter hiemivivus]|uniref:ATP-dependent Clp protease ATP-binding subunit n=1 Tax=Pedobacter hiemivivus TaxID=2530454 RepID=A0A4V5PBT9_9SPHI|nr:AAA family ATPase [Pedobacter hiemivivus]TKC57156.1 ATP-dependent Clp protease ATP-binding subunit [Pedobacter hiemivivus]
MQEKLLFFSQDNFYKYRGEKDIIGLEIVSITTLLQNFEKVSDLDVNRQIVDITSIVSLNEIQYNAENIFPLFEEDTIFIADRKYKDLLTYSLRYCFLSFEEVEVIEDVFELLTDPQEPAEIEEPVHRKIINLDKQELDEFLANFSQELYGHDKFKDDFAELIDNFRVFNKLGEHKILSLFLMGESGVGKTEVARAIHKCLDGNKRLAKINFGNYSSDNSLNSLIGSPRGYIGSDEGEIFIRVKNSDTGLILIDEFEKSNSTLFNYFLDVLENGKMVSSMSHEIDLNGFIIIFTSNVSKNEFKERISPELRSRFDYKGHFSVLLNRDKLMFVKFRLESVIRKYNETYRDSLPPNIYDDIIGQINVSEFNNMRDLNKRIKSLFVKFISQNQVALIHI